MSRAASRVSSVPIGVVIALLAALAPASAALAGDADAVVRDCATRAYGDLGSDWRGRAVVAGPLAFVGMRAGIVRVPPPPRDRARPIKVLVVVDPGAVATVTVGARSRAFAALAYALSFRQGGVPVPLSAGSTSVRFEACARATGREPWNRGTQFPGSFLLAGPRCVEVEVRTGARATVLRRTLRFGARRCGG